VPLGFLFAAFFLVRAQPRWWSLAAGSAVALIGVGIRAVASGHVKKNEELAMTGPYAYTRNPLYLGSIVIAAGFALAALRWEC
jgi:protein-S-isoprenylcysteine O-methyltransferase Ste14